MTDDEAALLRAVLTAPLDDTPRLIYADWLDDHDQPERAEFIRVQCEAARGGSFEIMRIWELLHHSAEWFPDVCRAFGFETHNWGVMPDGAVRYESKHADGEFFVRRGFVDELRVPTLATLFGGPCGQCEGLGGEERYPADDPTNRLMHGSHWYPCPACTGTGHTAGIAAEVFRWHPVLKIVTDREPNATEYGMTWTRDRDHYGSTDGIPSEVFDLMDLRQVGYDSKYADSRDAALTALSNAIVNRCRKLAGLEPVGSESKAETKSIP